MSKIMKLAACLAIFFSSVGSAQAAFVYVGSYDFITLGGLSDGMYHAANPLWWQNNPAVYNAVEAAAIIFGGSASDYAISTAGTDPGMINNLAYVDGWGDVTHLITPTSELFKLDTGAPGYNDPVGGPSFSALVFDHGPSFPGSINYVFRRDGIAVPEPTSLTLAGLGAIGLIAGVIRRRRQAKSAA